jgi:hypothetical protein
MLPEISFRHALLLVTAALALGCSKSEPSSATPPDAAPYVSAVPSASAAPSAAPSASASAPEPHHDCPAGSSGIGSYDTPCEAKGHARMMDVKWKKTADTGPSFAVANKAKLVIVWGRVAVYFYDKAGKQLDVNDDSVTPPKTRRFHTCSGQMFGGPMNAGEKAVITFSCVPKSVIPDGTTIIEAEMQMVGYADPSGKKIDFYWKNGDLTPDARPKGGVK